MKKCSKCKEEKEPTEFYKRSKNGKLRSICKECTNNDAREWQSRNRDKVVKSVRKWESKNKDKVKEYDRRKNLKAKYGITLEFLEGLRTGQGSKCKVCNLHEDSLDRPLVVDHNHKTGEVRGLLCHKCNTGLGLLKDSPRILKQALEYLEENGYYGE